MPSWCLRWVSSREKVRCFDESNDHGHAHHAWSDHRMTTLGIPSSASAWRIFSSLDAIMLGASYHQEDLVCSLGHIEGNGQV